MTVVRIVTTSSTNMTGFLACLRGSSLRKAEPMAGRAILGSSSVATGVRCRTWDISIEITPSEAGSEAGAGDHGEVLDDRPERQGREEGQAADDEDHPHHQADEQPACRGQRAG